MENSLYWSSITTLGSSLHAFCGQIASTFDGFVVFILFVNLFRGMPVAAHSKVSGGFCRSKTQNLIDSWSYFYFQTFCDRAIQEL